MKTKVFFLAILACLAVLCISCDSPRTEYWKTDINTDCEVWGIKDPAHNIDWIWRDITLREDGVTVLWPDRSGYQEFYTIWTNSENSEDQLVALTWPESTHPAENPWWHWQFFWNSEHEAVFGEEETRQARIDDYNYISEHYACTDTICVMTVVKRRNK